MLGGTAAIATLAASRSAVAGRAAGSDGFTYEVTHTEAEWREMLSEFEYVVLREGGTETRKSSPLWAENRAGSYSCRGCGLHLYESEWKKILSIGWVFFRHNEANSVLMGVDWPEGSEMAAAFSNLAQIEAHCRRCGSHLGHVVSIDNGVLHCINGAALTFELSEA